MKKMKTMMRGAQTSLRLLKPPNWGKLSRFRGSFLLTRSNEKISAIMTLLRIIVRSSVGRGRLWRELDSGSWLGCSLIAIRSSRGCSPVSTLRFEFERNRGLAHLHRVYLRNQYKLKACKWLLSPRLTWLHHRQQAQSFRVLRKEHTRKGPKRTLLRGANGPIFPLNFLPSSLSACLYLASSRLPVSVGLLGQQPKRSCFFFDVEARVAYRTKLHMFCGRVCIGISSGFVIQQSLATDLMLTNPMTSQRVDFPQMLPDFYIRRSGAFWRLLFAQELPVFIFAGLETTSGLSSHMPTNSGPFGI